MPFESQIILSITLYKLASLGVGLSSLYMGYRLFISGIWGASGDVDATFQNNRLVIKRAAPGTFFAVFGTIIVCTTLIKGLELTGTSQLANPDAQSTRSVVLPDNPPVSGETK